MSRKTILVAVIALVFAGLELSPLCATEKMTPGQLVSLHLDAIGPADARSGMKSRVFRGEGVWRVFQGGHARLPGTVFEASDGDSISLRFDTDGNPTYYGEHLIYNGKNVRIFQGFPGGRSPLGEYCMTNKTVLREGLLGGVTSTAWTLLHPEASGAKLKYAGLRKVEGRRLHCLDYKARKGGGPEKIQLFFEPDTYRHVLTRYSNAVYGRAATTTITETFSNFQEVDGLTLPTRWKIHYNSRSGIVAEWEFAFKNVVHNQPIDPALYELGAAAQ
ncbi:MAG: hypothetical protein OXB98_08490 [Bryobacterales bacterium]|nr:hypothetical protein [Bryobacterales bacterium]